MSTPQAFEYNHNHPANTKEPDATLLWRYMTFGKFESLIERRALYFRRAKLLNDSFEGQLNSITLKHIESFPEVGPNNRRLFEWAGRLYQDLTYLNCWSGQESESSELWKTYAAETDSVAVKSTLGHFKEALGQKTTKSTQDVYIGRVQYIDRASDLIVNHLNVMNGYLYKERALYEFEKETRAFFSLGPQENYPDGFFVPVKCDQLISEVVTHPNSTPSDRLAITASITKNGFSFLTRKSVFA